MKKIGVKAVKQSYSTINHTRWRSLGKEGFAGGNGDVGQGHVDETKICRGEELGDRRSCEEQQQRESLGELIGIKENPEEAFFFTIATHTRRRNQG